MLMKKLIFAIVIATLSSCIVRKRPPTQAKFLARTSKALDILLDKIDKPQWRIGYNFTADCPAAFRQQEQLQLLKEMITKALQTWLRPLRARYPNKQFTDNFLLVRQPDVAACEEDRLALRELDTRITIDCAEGAIMSFARIALAGEAPDLCIIAKEEAVNHRFSIASLVHELGHAFGLGDTYVRGVTKSTGGLAHTMEKQPAAIMAGIYDSNAPFALGKDDKNGIIWLYKYLYEDHPAGDCFFPDYIRIERDGICRHKYPLIFEAKHGALETVEQIIIDDPTLKLNGRDSHGMTALHYAVQRADSKMVQVLLAQAGIKVNLLNGHKRTPAQLARVLKLRHLAKMIEAHPTAKHHPQPWSVNAKGKKPVTWGELKRGDH